VRKDPCIPAPGELLAGLGVSLTGSRQTAQRVPVPRPAKTLPWIGCSSPHAS